MIDVVAKRTTCFCWYRNQYIHIPTHLG